MMLKTLDDLKKMNDEARTEIFLATFKTFEAFLSRLVKTKGEFTSYSQALNIAYSQKLSPILTGDNYDFLRSVGELRNILSHNNDVCNPNPEFLYKFLLIADSMMYPLKSIDIATPYSKMMKASMNYKVGKLIFNMKEKGFTHVPVAENNKLIGVFSVSTFFDKALTGGFSYSPNDTVKDYESLLDSHNTERFIFVSKDVSAFSLRDMLKKTKVHEKRAAVIFVTDNGSNNGKLLGMITETDLLKIKIN